MVVLVLAVVEGAELRLGGRRLVEADVCCVGAGGGGGVEEEQVTAGEVASWHPLLVGRGEEVDAGADAGEEGGGLFAAHCWFLGF